MKKIILKLKILGSFGNCCNFCFTDNGLTENVNEIYGHGISIRICDDCLKELNKQTDEINAKKKIQ